MSSGSTPREKSSVKKRKKSLHSPKSKSEIPKRQRPNAKNKMASSKESTPVDDPITTGMDTSSATQSELTSILPAIPPNIADITGEPIAP